MERATEWLITHQNADGSWGGSGRRGTDSSAPARVADTAYIAWTLAESGAQTRGLHGAFDFLRGNLHDTDAPYTIALAANAFLTHDANDAFAQKLLTALQTRLQAQDLTGYSGPENVGAMYSRGLCLDIETTALAAMAMMKVNPHADMVHKALTWIKPRSAEGQWKTQMYIRHHRGSGRRHGRR